MGKRAPKCQIIRLGDYRGVYVLSDRGRVSVFMGARWSDAPPAHSLTFNRPSDALEYAKALSCKYECALYDNREQKRGGGGSK